MSVRSEQRAMMTPERDPRALYPRTRRIRFRFNQEAGRKYFVAGAAVCTVLLPLTLATLAVSVGSDPVARRRPDRLARETYDLFTGPIFKGLLRDLAVYLRPGFHPDDVDTSALALQWRDTLFGTDGVLVDHPK